MELTSLRWSLELSASWQSLGIPGPCNCSDALPLSSLVPASRPCKRNYQRHCHCIISNWYMSADTWRDLTKIIQLPGLVSRVSVWNYVYNGCAWNCFWCGARCAYYSVRYPALVFHPLLIAMNVFSWHYFYQLTLLHSENREKDIWNKNILHT